MIYKTREYRALYESYRKEIQEEVNMLKQWTPSERYDSTEIDKTKKLFEGVHRIRELLGDMVEMSVHNQRYLEKEENRKRVKS